MKYLFSILVVLSLSFNFALSQDASERLLPKMLGASNAGKEFLVTFLPCWDDPASPDNSLRIYVSSQFKTKVKLEVFGLGISRYLITVPNTVMEFSLPTAEGQVYTKGNGSYPIPPKPEQIWEGRAIKITSDDPILCYGMTRFDYKSEGFLALPFNNWGKNYQVASYADFSNNKAQYLPSETAIVAAFDKTEVTFKLGGNLNSFVHKLIGDSLKYGETIKRTLNAGDVWLLSGIGPNNDLTGSQISSNKNIGVFSGNFSASVPMNVGSNNFLCEQEIPTDYWGKNYYVPTIANRKYSSIVKVFAKEANTEILFNNLPIYNITQLDGKEGTGYFELRATSDSLPIPVLINSNKNINVVLYNTGQKEDNGAINTFQMNLIPEEQYLNEVTFITPGFYSKTMFDSNFINIIFKSKSNIIPDDMFIAQMRKDTILWIKLSEFVETFNIESFKNEIPDIDGYLHYSLTFKIPKAGAYKIKAKEPFGIYGYGCSKTASYGYPLSCGMVNQTFADTVVPEIVVNDLKNGNYSGTIKEKGNIVGKTTKYKDDLQNESDIAGYSLIEMINDLSYNCKFERDSFIPGEFKLLNFKLTTIDSLKDAKAVIYVSDKCGNDTTIIFKTTNPLINQLPTLTGEINDFGFFKTGQKKQFSFKFKNHGKTESIPIYRIMLESDKNGFKILSDLTFPLILKENEEKSFIIEFSADTKNGEFLNNIGIDTPDTTLFLCILKSTVINPSINVPDINFGNFTIGNDAFQKDIIISNNSHSILEINKIDFPMYNVFIIKISQPSISNPIKIPAFKSIKIPVEFNPTVPGNFEDNVVFYSDGKIIKNISNLLGKAIANSVEEIENKYGMILIYVKNNGIAFKSKSDYLINSLKIYDLKSNIIQTENPNTLLNNYNIILNNISGSVYFIELNTQYGKVVKKIIIE